MFPLLWIKTAFLRSDKCATADGYKCCTHPSFTDLVSNRCQPRILLYLATTFVWAPTTSVDASWQSAGWPWYREHSVSKSTFNFNVVDMVQILKSMLMVITWYKPEIALYFYEWCFSIFITRGKMWTEKGILWVKASERTATLCETTRHHQHGMGKITIKYI